MVSKTLQTDKENGAVVWGFGTMKSLEQSKGACNSEEAEARFRDEGKEGKESKLMEETRRGLGRSRQRRHKLRRAVMRKCEALGAGRDEPLAVRGQREAGE